MEVKQSFSFGHLASYCPKKAAVAKFLRQNSHFLLAKFLRRNSHFLNFMSSFFKFQCTISGRSSLEHVTSLTLAVSCPNSTDNLGMLSVCLRSLTTLRLDYSNIRTLRYTQLFFRGGFICGTIFDRLLW